MHAPAKLNLYLDVRGRRSDGYHELETLFVALDFGDEVEVEPRATRGVTLDLEFEGAAPGTSLALGLDNLVVRAAETWLAAAGARAPFAGVHARLRKRVPVGGGLGGGSSDAAATLRALEALVPEPDRLGPSTLHGLARGLGADVPFFLVGGAAVGRGRGDELTSVPGGRALEVVLITPPWGHETARVFQHLDGAPRRLGSEGLSLAIQALQSGEPQRLRAAHENGLARAAMRAYPAFTRFTSAVERALGRAPCLSGSGSTLFDVPDPGEAESMAGRVRHLTEHVVRTRLAL